MLVLKDAKLVYLANPKTATQSLRAALGPHAGATPKDTGHKHINAALYARKWASVLKKRHGGAFETFAVMREPLEHLGSWHRYRQREAIRGSENSTHGIGFDAFIEAVISPDPPAFARIGRQARFLGFLADVPPVHYIFDYAQIDLLLAFLDERLSLDQRPGANLKLPLRNVSPEAADDALHLPDNLKTRLTTALSVEFDLYDRVALAGVLETAPPA